MMLYLNKKIFLQLIEVKKKMTKKNVSSTTVNLYLHISQIAQNFFQWFYSIILVKKNFQFKKKSFLFDHSPCIIILHFKFYPSIITNLVLMKKIK